MTPNVIRNLSAAVFFITTGTCKFVPRTLRVARITLLSDGATKLSKLTVLIPLLTVPPITRLVGITMFRLTTLQPPYDTIIYMTPPLTLRILFPMAVTRTPLVEASLFRPLVLTRGRRTEMVVPTACVAPIIRGKNTLFPLKSLFIRPTLLTSGFLTMPMVRGHPRNVLLTLGRRNLATFPRRVHPNSLLIVRPCYLGVVGPGVGVLLVPVVVPVVLVPVPTLVVSLTRLLVVFPSSPNIILLTSLSRLPGTPLQLTSVPVPMTLKLTFIPRVRRRNI